VKAVGAQRAGASCLNQKKNVNSGAGGSSRNIKASALSRLHSETAYKLGVRDKPAERVQKIQTRHIEYQVRDFARACRRTLLRPSIRASRRIQRPPAPLPHSCRVAKLTSIVRAMRNAP